MNRRVAVGATFAIGLTLSFCAFLLARIGEGTFIPAAIIGSPFTLIAWPVLGLDRAIIVGFFVAPAYWAFLGWVISWRSNRRALLLTALLLGQYLGAAVTSLSDLSFANALYYLQRETELQPVVMGVFILVYVSAQGFFWHSVGPIRLLHSRLGDASDSSEGWWPKTPEK